MIQRKYYKTIRVIVDSDGGGTPFYIENVDTVPGYFALIKQGTPTYTPNLNYRIDNGEWFEYDVVNLPRIEVPIGSKIYLKGNNTNGFNQSSSGYTRFKFFSSSTTTTNYCKCNVGGYITSLLALENFNLISNIPNYSFCNLFNQLENLISAENLITDNIINVGESSFSNCFYNCSSLVTAPTFSNVTSVEKNGFDSCFSGCTSLVTSPMFESVTSVVYFSFGRCFQNCKSLVTPPTFENVTSVGNSGFDSCFYGCTSLVTSPMFESVTSVVYFSFGRCFQNCTSLVTPPNFRKITSIGSSSFEECFDGCISLQTIIAPRPSSWNTSYFTKWVSNVPTSGTFYKKKGLEIPTGTNGIPEGWTVVEEA